MANEQVLKVNEARVRESIDRYIQNDGQISFYIKAPSEELVAKYLYFDNQAKKTGPGPTAFVASPIIRMHMNMHRLKFYVNYTTQLLSAQGNAISSSARSWKAARYFEEHPKERAEGGWRRLFWPCSWFQSPQQYLDRSFLYTTKMGYEWLQEDQLLEQCNIKNWYAILGFDLIIKHNQRPETSQKAPLNEFVGEQIRRIPEEIIKRSLEQKIYTLKWVNGDRIVDFNSTLGELYPQ